MGQLISVLPTQISRNKKLADLNATLLICRVGTCTSVSCSNEYVYLAGPTSPRACSRRPPL